MNQTKAVTLCLELINSCYPLLINKHVKWFTNIKNKLLLTNSEIQYTQTITVNSLSDQTNNSTINNIDDSLCTKNSPLHDIIYLLKFIVYGFEDPNLYISYPDNILNIPYFPEILVLYKDKQLIVFYSTNKKLPKGTIIQKLNNSDPLKMLDNLIYMWGGKKDDITRAKNAPRLLLHFNGQRIPKIKSIQANKGAGIKLYWTPCVNWQSLILKASSKPKKYKSKFINEFDHVHFHLVDYHTEPKVLHKAFTTLTTKVDGFININVSGNTYTSRQFIEQFIDIIYGKSYKFPKEIIYQTVSQTVCDEWASQIIYHIHNPDIVQEQKQYLQTMKKKIINNQAVMTKITPKHRISNTSCFIGQLNIDDDTLHHSQDLLKYYLGHPTCNFYTTFNHLEFNIIENIFIHIPTAIQFFDSYNFHNLNLSRSL